MTFGAAKFQVEFKEVEGWGSDRPKCPVDVKQGKSEYVYGPLVLIEVII